MIRVLIIVQLYSLRSYNSTMSTHSISIVLLVTIPIVLNVDIGLNDICGNKLVGSCPNKISLKVVGGQSSCAEKVPWNVLIELTQGNTLQASGNQWKLKHYSEAKVF